MAPFDGSSSPTEGATETTTATLTPAGTLRFPADAPRWLTRAPYVEFVHYDGDLFGVEPVYAGRGEVRPLEDVDDGVECAVADALRTAYGVDPTTLPEPFELRLAYDDDAERLLLNVEALFDGLVDGIEGGERTVSVCPWC